jgi:hypothetical protein
VTENDYRPKGWSPKNIPTIWVDHTTGQGVTGDGTMVRPKVGERRKNPNLVDLLDTAASYGAERVMLTGKTPEPPPGVRHWLLVKTPHWKPEGHWLAAAGLTGRFVHATTGQRVQLRLVSEWFGAMPLTPAQARSAWDTTAAILKSIDDRATMFLTPGMTGTNLWAWSLPKNVNPVPLSDDVAAELHLTSGQHHLEHLVAGPNFSSHDDCVPLIDPAKTPKIQTFAHTDGRFMYAAMGRELGVGPGVRLNRAAAWELLQTDPYARARYEVRFTVPTDWRHVGLLGVRHDMASDGWFFPNRPGAVHVTWADASEVAVALGAGWLVEPLQAVKFFKARPFDTFAERITRARERLQESEELPPLLKRAVGAALRNILIQSVGALAARGRDTTQVVTSALEVPPEFQASIVRHGELFTYKVPSVTTARNAAFYHPEISAQIWGRARARVLVAPTAQSKNGGGALAVAPHTLIGINGDAIYTTSTPPWALPVEHGGGDDGKTGRLRLASTISGSFRTPDTLAARDALRARADRVGPSGAWTAVEPGEGN